MNALVVTVICGIAFVLGYRFYSRFLAKKIFTLDFNAVTPAHQLKDGIDYVPSARIIVFGHHFVSIAGLSPMLGPAIAVIWGWLPALLWIVLGTIFIGAVHDFSTLVVSLRHQGRSIGDLTEQLIGQRARLLFLLIIFFLLSLAMGVFAYIVAIIFSNYHPEAVIPVFSLMPIALLTGALIYRNKLGMVSSTLIGLVLMLIMVWVGIQHPISNISPSIWIYILLVYAFTASVLPVWLLLQPRDYLNSFQLYLGLALMYGGLIVSRPNIVAPAFNFQNTGAPSLFPFLFIIIACGAISGFHSLVSSGTTAKQLNKETDARPVGYGGMIAEGVLGVMAVLAVTAGVKSAEIWNNHYASWDAASGLGTKLNVFINGAGFFISQLGISEQVAITFVSVVVVGFAMTTLDSGTRLLRYNISEIVRSQRFNINASVSRYAGSLLAAVAVGYFALMKIGGKPAGLALWQLFGTTNQLLAGLALLAISVYLYQKGKSIRFTLVPMFIMLVVTISAMAIKVKQFWQQQAMPLLTVGIIILIMAIWLAVEACFAFRRKQEERGTVVESTEKG